MIDEVTVGRDTRRHTHAEEKKYCPEFRIHSVHLVGIYIILWLSELSTYSCTGLFIGLPFKTSPPIITINGFDAIINQMLKFVALSAWRSDGDFQKVGVTMPEDVSKDFSIFESS